MVDIATRVWNHKWKIDPIVRSLIDTDFYKLLMCQSVFRNHPDTRVQFSLINRTKTIRLAELVDEGELREQLDHIRSLSLTRGESTWLRGNTFYGKRQMFRPDFMEWFENLQLPPYHLEKRDGQYELTFEGSWPEVMLWEIPALAILMELRGRAVLRDMGCRIDEHADGCSVTAPARPGPARRSRCWPPTWTWSGWCSRRGHW